MQDEGSQLVALALAVMFAVVMPHVYWLVQNDWLPVRYALHYTDAQEARRFMERFHGVDERVSEEALAWGVEVLYDVTMGYAGE